MLALPLQFDDEWDEEILSDDDEEYNEEAEAPWRSAAATAAEGEGDEGEPGQRKAPKQPRGKKKAAAESLNPLPDDFAQALLAATMVQPVAAAEAQPGAAAPPLALDLAGHAASVGADGVGMYGEQQEGMEQQQQQPYQLPPQDVQQPAVAPAAPAAKLKIKLAPGALPAQSQQQSARAPSREYSAPISLATPLPTACLLLQLHRF